MGNSLGNAPMLAMCSAAGGGSKTVRVRAAQLLAGNPPVRQIAKDAGLSYRHLLGVVNATEPLLKTDAGDLSRVLNMPASWLARGWDNDTV